MKFFCISFAFCFWGRGGGSQFSWAGFGVGLEVMISGERVCCGL